MIYLGADHGGFSLKEQLKNWLTEWHISFTDLGAHRLDAEDDYPEFALAVAQAVAADPAQHKGILACRSAAGVIIAANKVKKIRAVAPANATAAQHSREHNDANVLGLSGDWLTVDSAKVLVQQWLNTPFSSEARHQRRIDQISQFENTV
jgi:ribose 5-phosphate isomerase B